MKELIVTVQIVPIRSEWVVQQASACIFVWATRSEIAVENRRETDRVQGRTRVSPGVELEMSALEDYHERARPTNPRTTYGSPRRVDRVG